MKVVVLLPITAQMEKDAEALRRYCTQRLDVLRASTVHTTPDHSMPDRA